MKKLIKYQLADCKFSIIIYYAVIFLLFGIGAIQMVANYDGEGTMISPVGFCSIIFCFVFGICIFREYFLMSIQNGYSRKTFFKSVLCTIAVICFFMSIVEWLITFIFGFVQNVEFFSMLYVIYPSFTEELNGPLFFIVSLLYFTVLLMMCTLMGYLISTLFYISNKVMRIMIAAGLPIFVFGILPLASTYFPGIFYKVSKFLYFVLGFQSHNPLISIVSFALISVILVLCNYQVVKKAHV